PASIGGFPSASIFLQYSPEFRRVTAGSSSDKTTTARFPLVSAILPVGQRWTLGLSSSTFLDRSYETDLVRSLNVGAAGDTVQVTENSRVLGAINDVRLALAWVGSQAFRVGFGGHVFSGSNRITFRRIFPDTVGFVGTQDGSRISYAGFAASIGLEYRPSRAVGFAASARKGGDLTAQSNDTTIGRGRLPDHYSGSFVYEGIPGASFSARVAHDGWSSLSSLSSARLQAFDTWDMSVGGEATGPRFIQRVLTLRAGARRRTLPFGFAGDKVSETDFMLGLGAPLTRDRANIDFALQRAMRTAGSVNERGYILSFGLRVSP
ncbi:MAG: hypothetical protein ABR585_04330, partial [Gemmatimonadaceae bacterium]